MQAGAPQDAQTVPIHVQVIDMESFALNMTVPTYITVGDLTTRVARDAGLGAYWEDGSRRSFYLRARGRVLGEEEKLQDLGIVPHELLHLLPQPPVGSGVLERPPEYPPNKGYSAAGNLNVVAGLAVVGGWSAAWAVGITYDQGPLMGLFPGMALALLCVSLSRHLWGGQGNRIRVPATGAALYLPLMLLACFPTVLLQLAPWTSLALLIGPAFIGGMIGILLGWLAWYGAVEPLPKITQAAVQQAVVAQVHQCGICAGEVGTDVKVDCRFGCGRAFHAGCYKAKEALNESGGCAVCGYVPAA